MSAADHLNKQLFHGTAAILNIGDVLEPRGIYNTFSSPDVAVPAVYATTDPNDALNYAYTGMIVNKTKGKPYDRGAIYEVEPVDPTEKLSPRPDDPHRVSRKGFKITGVHRWVNWED